MFSGKLSSVQIITKGTNNINEFSKLTMGTLTLSRSGFFFFFLSSGAGGGG